MTAEVSLVSNCDDWEGVYLNGMLFLEDHTISAKQLLWELSERGIIQFYNYECSSEWLGEIGYLPDNLQDVEVL